MRPLLLLVAFALAVSLVQTAEYPKPITPVEAIAAVGKPKVVVEMNVCKAKDRLEKRGIIYLDSAEAAVKYKAKGIADPAAHFLNKTVRVTGCVMRFEERPYLPIYDPEQIAVVDAK